MDQDDDDFLYGDSTPAAPQPQTSEPQPPTTDAFQKSPTPSNEPPSGDEDEEEVEVEVEVSDDDDIELVTERKDGSRADPPARPQLYNQIRTASTRPSAPSSSSAAPSPVPTSSTPIPPQPQPQHPDQQPQYPPQSTSTLSLALNPPYGNPPTPITKISLDSDLLPAEKPWRKPGADVTDYFNYGFDEFTWTAYCAKQEGLREEFNPQKMMEQMMMMGGMGMMGGMVPGAGMGMEDPSMVGMMGGGMDMAAAAGGGGDMGMFMGQPGGQGGQGFVGQGGQGGPGGDGGFGMGRGQIPQGPAQGQMGGYGGYDQNMMQGARGPASFGPRGRGVPARRW